ncbi:MAG: phasin family protein [Sphingomonadales bacterium]
MPAARKTTAEKAAEKVVEAQKEQLENAFKASSEAATKNIEKSFEMTKKTMDEAVKGFDEIAAFSKENVDAMMASSNAATKGLESMNAEIMAYSKSAMEDSMAAMKALTGAKNLREYFDIQNAMMKSSYDRYVAESSKFSEMGLKIMSEVAEPVNARMAVVMEKMAAPIARA